MDGTGDLNGDCEKNRRILKQMVQDGHEVGIHGFDHKRWPSISDEEWLKQVEITGSLITEVTQIKSWIIRAPGG